MFYFTETDVQELLPVHEAIRLMRLTFEALAEGRAQNQPRRRLILESGSVLHSMAGAFINYFGTKFYSTNPRYGAHFYFVLYDGKTAMPLAMMEANHLGQIRTGAASGYATDLLANPEADTVGIIGSGFQARTQLAAIRAVRPRLVLMDIQLPDIDGLQLTREFKADPSLRDIPVVAVTSYAMKSDRQKTIDAGCDGYITKPIDTRQFPLDIEKYLRGPRGGSSG